MSQTQLKLGDSLALPLDAVTQTFGILALRSLGLIEYPAAGSVRASDLLFPGQ